MKIAYFDCVTGASGDMILGALVGAGLPVDVLRQRLAALNLDNFELHVYPIDKRGIQATKVDVLVQDDVPERRLGDIEAIIAASDLSLTIKEQANPMIRRLGTVEADIHGTTLEEVHLHELGGIDTIVDIVGTLIGLEELRIERVVVSPLPLGRGIVESQHGKLPVPAPATIALLKGVPVVGSEFTKELVTPTAALLLSSLASAYGPIPPMTLAEVGYGAGQRDLPIANVLRLLIGRQVTPDVVTMESLVLLETNIDDLNPEIYDYVMARLFAEHALDVFWTPVQMKKNRPGILLSVLCQPGDVPVLIQTIFTETTTLGIRQQVVSRHALARSTRTVETAYGSVRIKMAFQDGKLLKVAPEYEDCRQLAEANGVALRQVYAAAQRAAGRQGNTAERQR